MLKKRLLFITSLVLIVPLVLAACEEENGAPENGTIDPFETPATGVETPTEPDAGITATPDAPDAGGTGTPTMPMTPTPDAGTPGGTAEPTPTPVAEAGGISIVMLQEAGGSGQTGVAVLRSRDGQTEVTVGLLDALAAGEQQQQELEAAILMGTCDSPGELAHEVGPLAGGIVMGTISEAMDALTMEELAIVVSEAGDPTALVSCGSIADSRPVEDTNGMTVPAPGPAQ